MNGNVLRVAAAAVIGVLLLSGGYYLFGGGGGPGIGALATPTPTLAPSASSAAVPAASPTADLRGMKGTILLEHFGDAFDGSEAAKEPDAEDRAVLPDQPRRERPAGVHSRPAGGRQGPRECVAQRDEGGLHKSRHPDQIWLAAISGSAPELVSTACQCQEDFPPSRRTGSGSSSRTTTVRRPASPSVTSPRARSRRSTRPASRNGQTALEVDHSNPDGPRRCPEGLRTGSRRRRSEAPLVTADGLRHRQRREP